MSIKLMSSVWELDLPPGEKLVLLALADQANDQGVQCWPSIGTIALRSGQNERTVRRALRSLEIAGHLTAHFRTGDSTQYHIHPGHHAPPDKLPVRTKTTETPDTTPPKPSRTTKLPKKDKPSLVAHELPDDWEPADFGIGTQSRKLVDGWPPGELKYQLEHFRAHHRKGGTKWKDWQATWSTWVLNSPKFGAGNGRSAPLGRHQPANDGLSATTRAAIRVFGDCGDGRVPQRADEMPRLGRTGGDGRSGQG